MDDGDGSAQKVTRDYQLVLTTQGAPLLSVHGGKLTTYRTLAQKAVDKLQAVFPTLGPQWTAEAPLPGAEAFDEQQLATRLAATGLDSMTQRRWIRSYGMDALKLAAQPLGQSFGEGLFEVELNWMVEQEWACTAEDALFRRSKMGVVLTPDQRQAVVAWFDQKISSDLSPNRLRNRVS